MTSPRVDGASAGSWSLRVEAKSESEDSEAAAQIARTLERRAD